MRADSPETEDSQPEHMPPALRQALEATVRHDIDVPPEVDEAILEDARLHLRGIRQRKPAILVLRAAALGLAACAVVAVGLSFFSPSLSKSRPGVMTFSREEQRAARIAPEDVDGNGRVDILDAFALARRIEVGSSQSAWDLNSDGAVDRSDVNLVAMAAVRLGEEAVR